MVLLVKFNPQQVYDHLSLGNSLIRSEILERNCIVAETGAAAQSKGSGNQGSYGMIPLKDLNWAADQKPSVFRLFADCWSADPYGSRWMQLNTKLKRAAFMQAKKELAQQGLFVFKPEPSIQDGRSTVCWMVKNLRGSRTSRSKPISTSTDAKSKTTDAKSTVTDAKSTVTDTKSTDVDCKLVGSSSEQGFCKASQNASISSHNLLNTLSVSERENFERYVRGNWHQEIRSMEAFLSEPAYLQEWLTKFYASPAGRAAKQFAIAAKYDWENDPRLMDWLIASNEGGYDWVQENEAEREERNAFYSWATKTNAYQGRIE